MSTKSLLFLGGVAVLTVIILLLIAPPSVTESDQEGVVVATSFYPLAFVVEQIGGEFAQVTNITPAAAEPHDFEPTPRQVTDLYETDLFIFNGGGIDAWASSIQHDLEEQGVMTLGASTLVPSLLEPPEGHGHGDEHEDEHEEEHEGEEDHDDEFDEHFWLDPNLVIIEAEAIRDLLIEIDPEHADAYTVNTETLIITLVELNASFAEGLAQCDLRVAVTSHAAFAYLAEAYDFEMIPIAGVTPHEEPSAGVLAEVAHEAEEWGVEYIFFESLVSPKLAETLAAEIGAQTLIFDPIEGLSQEQIDAGETYVTVMQNNLESLQTAMSCQ